MNYYLAIDQGTHASRACLFDSSGRLVSEHIKNIKLRQISHSHIEQDAAEIVDSVKEVVARLLQESAKPQNIAACGIAIQRSSVLVWRTDGAALSRVLSWQDTRASQQLDKLRFAENEIQQLSGLPLSAHYGATKLHYLLNKIDRQNHDLNNVRLSPLASYLLFHLLEEHPYIVDHTNAQRTQLFDIDRLNWSDRLATLFDIPLKVLPACVPVLSGIDKVHGKLDVADIPVTAISGDQNAAIYGASKLASEMALVNFGSGAFVLRLLDRYLTSKLQLSTIACSEQGSVQYAREATINGAGSALLWLEMQHAHGNIQQQLPAWLTHIKQPPVFINTIGGLGSPWWNNEIEPVFIKNGKTLNTADTGLLSLPEQAVAVIESIVFMVCCNLEIMQSERSLSQLRVCGGLSHLDGLCQRLADLSGLTVERQGLTETTSRGIAWLAAGRPADWSDSNAGRFYPVTAAALQERYRLFKAELERLLLAQ